MLHPVDSTILFFLRNDIVEERNQGLHLKRKAILLKINDSV